VLELVAELTEEPTEEPTDEFTLETTEEATEDFEVLTEEAIDDLELLTELADELAGALEVEEDVTTTGWPEQLGNAKLLGVLPVKPKVVDAPDPKVPL